MQKALLNCDWSPYKERGLGQKQYNTKGQPREDTEGSHFISTAESSEETKHVDTLILDF